MTVNRAITGATTVNASSYATVTYLAATINFIGGTASIEGFSSSVTRYFGPGQSIPASFSVVAAGQYTVTFNLVSGVEFSNS